MHRLAIPVLLLAGALAGCSSGANGVSTASVLGGAPTPPAGAAPAAGVTPVAVTAAPSDPTGRAFQVGSVSARAVKCGYNFDVAKLKASYLAYETGRGSDVARLQQIYDVAYNGVTKATADDPSYCTDKKTGDIKADLGRLLAGDFATPAKPVVAKKDDGGLFSGWFDGGENPDSGPSFGSGDWWESQKEKAGN